MRIQILIYMIIFATIAITMENYNDPDMNFDKTPSHTSVHTDSNNTTLVNTDIEEKLTNFESPLRIQSNMEIRPGLHIRNDFDLKYVVNDPEEIEDEENENKPQQLIPLKEKTVNRKLFSRNMNSINIKPKENMFDMNKNETLQFVPSNTSNRLIFLNQISTLNETIDEKETVEANAKKMSLEKLRELCVTRGSNNTNGPLKHLNYICLNVLTSLKREEIKKEIKDDYEELAYSIGGDEKKLNRLKENLENFSAKAIFDLKKEVDQNCHGQCAPMKISIIDSDMKAEVQKIFLDKIDTLNQDNNTLDKNKQE